MFVVPLPEKKTGRTILFFRQSRRVNGKTIQETVEKIGYLDELQALYPDPIKHFQEEAKVRSKELKDNNVKLTVSLDDHFQFTNTYTKQENKKGDSDLFESEDLGVCYGMLPLSQIYNELEIGYFLDNRRRSNGAGYNLNHVFQMLVYGRILFPDSKLGTWKQREKLLGQMDFSDDDVYRSLSFYARQKDDLIAHLDKKVTKLYGRHRYPIFYDVTNYYWEIDKDDETDSDAFYSQLLRKRGCSKEHRPEPIVQMGLMMDSEGLPIDFDLFDGNTNDSITFSPMMGNITENLGREQVIYVADKAMLSGDNRAEIIVNHNGYVFSSSVRGAGGEVQDYILSQEDYVVSEDGTFMYKSRLTPVMLSVTDRSTGKKKKVRINENRIVFWSKKYQERARYERQKAIEKALKYGTAENRHGGNKYVKKTVVNKANGELIDNKEYLTELDLELIEQDEALDGFYMICSNVVGLDSRLGEKPFEKDFRFIEQDNCFQLNKEVNPLDIVDMYRELWQIEESFRIIKSLLKARPVFVHKDDSIRAHFLVCFVSLLILRILQKKKCGNTIEVGRMVESLQKASLVNIGDDIYASSYCDNIIEKLGSSLNLDLTRKKYNRQQLLKMLAQTRKS